jgi:hypothetical protein
MQRLEVSAAVRHTHTHTHTHTHIYIYVVRRLKFKLGECVVHFTAAYFSSYLLRSINIKVQTHRTLDLLLSSFGFLIYSFPDEKGTYFEGT